MKDMSLVTERDLSIKKIKHEKTYVLGKPDVCEKEKFWKKYKNKWHFQ